MQEHKNAKTKQNKSMKCKVAHSSEGLALNLTLTFVENLFTSLIWKIVRHKSLAFSSHSVSVNNVAKRLIVTN